LIDSRHRVSGQADDLPAIDRVFACEGHRLIGILRFGGGDLDRRGDLAERRGGFFQTGGLVFRALRKVVPGGRDLVCSGPDGDRGFGDARKGL
jgi:hypothetical protein